MIIRHWNDRDLVLLCFYSEVIGLQLMRTGITGSTTRFASLSLGGIREPWLSFAKVCQKTVVFGAADNCKMLISSITTLEGARVGKKRRKDGTPPSGLWLQTDGSPRAW